MCDSGGKPRIAVFCVGNRLMLDDGVGPAVYDELSAYEFPDSVDVYDVGCMSLDLIGAVDAHDVVISVDALEGTGQPAGTVLRFSPDDMAERAPGSQSLHDLRLSDLFQAAELVGYRAQGVCFGVQVENASPALCTEGLTPPVYDAVAQLVDCVLAQVIERGIPVTERETGQMVLNGHHHRMRRDHSA